MFSKLFGKPPVGTRLEQYVDGITPKSMHLKVKTMADAVKVPYAQAMTVLLFSRVFTKSLRAMTEELPEPFKTTWPFQHDRIFAEVVGFYYFVLMKDLLARPDDEDDWPDDEVDDKQCDPYLDGLRQSLYLCSQIVHSLANTDIPEIFVSGRAISFSDVHLRKKSVIDVLIGSIMRVWNPNHDGRPILDLSAPTISVHSVVSRMPVDEVIAACRELYDEKARNPAAF